MMKRSQVLQAITLARSESAMYADDIYDTALTERTVLFFQELLLKISQRSYFLHPEFLPGIHAGRVGYVEYYGDEAPITLVEMLDGIESSLSRSAYKRENRVCALAGLSARAYEYHVGFVVGWCTAMIECGAAPVLPDVVNRRLAPALVHLIQSISEVL